MPVRKVPLHDIAWNVYDNRVLVANAITQLEHAIESLKVSLQGIRRVERYQLGHGSELITIEQVPIQGNRVTPFELARLPAPAEFF